MIAVGVAIVVMGVLAWSARLETVAVPSIVAIALAGSLGAAALGGVACAGVVAAWRLGARTPWLASAAAMTAGLGMIGMRQGGPVGTSALIAAAASLPLVISGLDRAEPLVRSAMGMVAVALGLFVGATLVFTAVTLVGVRSDAQDGIDAARRGLDAVEAGDQDLAIADLDEAVDRLGRAQRRVESRWLRPGRAIPILGPHLRAVVDLSATGADVVTVAAEAARLADLDTLRASGGRVDLDVVRGMQDPLNRLVASLDRARGALTDGRSRWLVPPLRDVLDDLALEVTEQTPAAEKARDGVMLLPEMLGADGERRYLVIFGTTSEAREVGGLLGNFVEVVATDGRISLGRAGRNFELSDAPGDGVLADPSSYPELFVASEPGKVPQNWTRIIDFPTAARASGELYATMGGRPVDGVAYLDPAAVAALLSFTGPIESLEAGQTFNSDNVEQFLLIEQYERFPDQSQRKDFLTDVSVEAFNRLLTIELPSPGKVADILGPVARRQNLVFTSFDTDEAEWLRRVGVDGTFPDPAGADLLSVVHVNKGSDKLDAYLTRSTAYRAQLTQNTPASREAMPVWTIDATVEVTLRNDVDPAGLPDYVLGARDRTIAPPGVNVAELSIYSPHDLVEIRVDGEIVTGDTYQEFGSLRHVTTVAIAPGEQRVAVFTLRGEWTGDPANYRLQFVAQPLVNASPTSIVVSADAVTLVDVDLATLAEDTVFTTDHQG